MSNSKQIVGVNFLEQSQRETDTESHAKQPYSATYLQRSLAAPRGDTLQQHQPQPFAWAKSAGSNTRWNNQDVYASSSASSSSFRDGKAHFLQGNQVQNYSQHGRQGYSQSVHPATRHETATAGPRKSLQDGSWTYDSARRAEQSSAVSNSRSSGESSVQDFWRQQHPAFNAR